MLSYSISLKNATQNKRTTACRFGAGLENSFLFAFISHRSFMFQVSVAYGASDELYVCSCMSLCVCLISVLPRMDKKRRYYTQTFIFSLYLSTFPALTCNLFAENMFSGHFISRIWCFCVLAALHKWTENQSRSTIEIKYSLTFMPFVREKYRVLWLVCCINL